MTEQAVFSQQQQQVIRRPSGFLRRRICAKYPNQSGIHKEPSEIYLWHSNNSKVYHASREQRLSLFWLTVILVTSCGAKDMKTYQEDQIQAVYIKEMADGRSILTVMPMLETLYFCPGVIIREEDDAMLVGLVRCRINTKCPVDIVATPDSASPGNYNIALPSTDKPVKIDYHSGATQVWP